MAVEVHELDGRSWGDTTNGGKVKRRFLITGLAIGFDPAMSYTGLPNVGDVHPSLSGYYVTSRDFTEGSGASKITVNVEVSYEKTATESGGEGQTAYNGAVEEWGWDGGTEDREMTTAADGTSVLNSAGDVFDSVPSVSTPSPVFTKVIKFGQRKASVLAYNCKVNSSTVAIGGETYPAKSLLATVAEKRIFGDPTWKYQYTIQLKYRSNPVKIAQAQALTDIGWDVAITDAGMREKDSNGKLVLIRQMDAETHKMLTVTSTELLDGNGHAIARGAEGQPPVPYNIRFQAYETASFPEWFYSEPT